MNGFLAAQFDLSSSVKRCTMYPTNKMCSETSDGKKIHTKKVLIRNQKRKNPSYSKYAHTYLSVLMMKCKGR